MEVAELLRLYEAKWTDALKAAYFKEHPENFAGPHMSYPIRDASDVSDAAGLYGQADDPEAVKSEIITIAKRMGFTSALPQSWKDELGMKEDNETAVTAAVAQESVNDASPSLTPPASYAPSPSLTPQTSLASPSPQQAFTPKARVARLRVRFLKNGATSKNGRIYPRETVERLVRSGQVALTDSNGPLLTSFTSHNAADNDDVSQLTGRLTDVWQENEDAFAWLDIPDTNAGRDMVSLAQGGYLRKMSLRARNALLAMEKGYDMPVVTGEGIQLEGIDFTTRPGIDIADIQGVLIENASVNLSQLLRETYPAAVNRMIDTFDVDLSQLLLETYTPDGVPLVESITASTPSPSTTPPLHQEEPPMPHAAPIAENKLRLDQIQIPVPTLDANGTLVYESIPMVASKLREAHNKVAGLLKMPCKDAKGGVAEAGRTISKATSDTLGEAHNALAMALGTECRYDPDGDEDDDSSLDPSDNPDAAQDMAQGMYTDVGVMNSLPAAQPQEHQTNRVQLPPSSHHQSLTKGEPTDMTREELLAQLAAEGFTIEAPKTPEQKLQEQFDAKLEAKLAEQRAQFEEMLKKFAPAQQTPSAPDPQRQTLSEAGLNQGAGNLAEGGRGNIPDQIYINGSYLQELIHPSKWAELADRTRPLPAGLNPQYALKEMSEVWAGAVIAGFNIPQRI